MQAVGGGILLHTDPHMSWHWLYIVIYIGSNIGLLIRSAAAIMRSVLEVSRISIELLTMRS